MRFNNYWRARAHVNVIRSILCTIHMYITALVHGSRFIQVTYIIYQHFVQFPKISLSVLVKFRGF